MLLELFVYEGCWFPTRWGNPRKASALRKVSVSFLDHRMGSGVRETGRGAF